MASKPPSFWPSLMSRHLAVRMQISSFKCNCSLNKCLDILTSVCLHIGMYQADKILGRGKKKKSKMLGKVIPDLNPQKIGDASESQEHHLLRKTLSTQFIPDGPPKAHPLYRKAWFSTACHCVSLFLPLQNDTTVHSHRTVVNNEARC